MRVDNLSEKQLSACYAVLRERAARGGEPVFVTYLDLGMRIVRLINYSVEFTAHVDKQLAYVVKDSCEQKRGYDVTLIIWREGALDTLAAELVKWYEGYREPGEKRRSPCRKPA